MRKYIITGGSTLSGEVEISGAKNVAVKAIVAACLTDEKVIINNVPEIVDVHIMLDLVRGIGGIVEVSEHSVSIQLPHITTSTIPLEAGAKTRTSTLFLAPLLARMKEAIIPNPGGCRIGARPIDRIVSGLMEMNVTITYHSEDGYFHAKTEGLTGAIYKFSKNSHTGTEALIMTAVLAQGKTIIENAALEPEIDSLISLLTQMGAHIKRDGKVIEVEGVEKLHGTEFTLPQDRNEVITFAAASVLTGGQIYIKDIDFSTLTSFMQKCEEAGIKVEEKNGSARFYVDTALQPTSVATAPYPGFMTDWQGPWAIVMTQAAGVSTILETVYENRFGYMDELIKMGAHISFVPDEVENPEQTFNFNYEAGQKYQQKIEIKGKTDLHNAVLEMSDLRAGATLVLAALIAQGKTIIYGVEQVERGYEKFDERLRKLGANILREEE